MPGFASLPLRIALVAGLLLVAGTTGPLAQQRVGVNSAVNPNATGAPPGAPPRRLVIGQDVMFNEHITTAQNGQTQLLFLDESSMTVGPNSDLTIDQFVYDPKSGTGKLAMSATRGLLRYVGGKLSKQDNAVTLRTSTATLAVRGGAFIANIDPNGKTEAAFIFGDGLQVTGLNGLSQTLRRPGFEVTVSGPGAAPSPPAPMPPGQLAQFNRQLDGRTGGTGGAPVTPTDAAVVSSGVPQTISGNLPASVQQAALNQVTTTQAAAQTNPNTSAQNTANTQANTGTGQVLDCGANCGNSIQVTTTPVTPPPPPPPTPPVAISYAGRFKSTNGNGTAQGFVNQGVAYSAGTLTFPTGSPQSGIFTANAGSLGTISFPLAQCSSASGCSANITNGTSSSVGPFTGTSFISGDNTFFYANITPTSQPTQRLFISGGTPVNSGVYSSTGNTRVLAFTVQPDAALQSNIPFIRSQTGGNLAGAAVSPLYVVAPATTAIGNTSTLAGTRALQASIAINGQGANQQSVIGVTTGTVYSLNGQPILSGQLRGSSLQSATGTPVRLSSNATSTVDVNGNSFYGGTVPGSAISGFVLDQSAATTTTGGIVSAVSPSTASEIPLSGAPTTYGFAQPATATAVPSGVGTSRTTQAQFGNFGGLMYTTAQTNPYIVTGNSLVSTDATNNRVQATLSGSAQSPSSGVNTLTMQYGSLAGAPGGQAFVDNNTFAAAESQINPQQINGQNLVVNGNTAQAGNLYLLSSGTTAQPTSLLPSGASYCQCQYLQWGYWGGALQTGNSANSTVSRVDAGHINTWVAGVATPLNDLATLEGQGATANFAYTGAAVGSVFNAGKSYVAAGGFGGTYNFGTQSGTMTISNFDGHTFSGSGPAPLNGNSYSFNSTGAGVTGSIKGSFYGPMAAETGGSFALQTTSGPSYLASGIYAGKR
jgi:hypothetical protein